VIACKSTKQKLNTKSSTEAKVVGASDYLPSTIWAMNFLRAQGRPIRTSDFQQDNQSAILLEKNGRTSAGQKSRHINIRHFWIKDRLKSDGITLRYCPTASMLADFLTKPLQGNLYRRFRDVLLGHAHVSTLATAPSPHAFTRGSEKRVGVQIPDENGAGKPITEKTVTWADVVKRRPKAADVAFASPTTDANASDNERKETAHSFKTIPSTRSF